MFEQVFTDIEINNDQNVNPLQNSHLIIQHIYACLFVPSERLLLIGCEVAQSYSF